MLRTLPTGRGNHEKPLGIGRLFEQWARTDSWIYLHGWLLAGYLRPLAASILPFWTSNKGVIASDHVYDVAADSLWQILKQLWLYPSVITDFPYICMSLLRYSFGAYENKVISWKICSSKYDDEPGYNKFIFFANEFNFLLKTSLLS